MPPNVHFSKLNPTIDLEDFAAEIPITTTALSGSMLSSGGIELTWDPGDPVGGVPSFPSLPVETPVLKKRQVFPRSASVAPMRM